MIEAGFDKQIIRAKRYTAKEGIKLVNQLLKHKDFKNYEWSYDYGRYIGSQDIDHQDCAQNAEECISVTYTGEGEALGFEFDSTSNLIYVEDPIVFTKITSIK